MTTLSVNPFNGRTRRNRDFLWFEREVPNLPDRIRQQASLTEKAIRERAGQEKN